MTALLRSRPVWQLIGETSLTRILAVACSFLGVLVVARALGPHGQGVVAAATNWATLLATVASLSLGQVSIHEAAGRPVTDWLPQTLGGVLVLSAFGAALGWLTVAVLLTGFPQLYGEVPVAVTLLGVALLPAYLWDLHAVSLTAAAGRTRFYNLTQLAGKIMALGLLVAGLSRGGGPIWVMLTNWVAVGGPGVLTLRDLSRRAGPLRVERAAIARLAWGALRLHLNTLGTFLLLPAHVLVINYYRGAAETGLYQLSAQFFGAMTLLPAAAATVLYGHLAAHGPVEGWAMQRRVLAVMTPAMTVGAIVFALWVAPWLVHRVAGPAYATSVPLLQWQVLALPGLTITSVMAPQWIVRGWFVQASALTAAAGIFNLILSVALVPTMGARGAVWATLSTYVVFGAVNLGVALMCERSWMQRRSADAILPA